MIFLFEILCFILPTPWAASSISGISYMDPLMQKPLEPYLPGEDPCNPLYWYPRHVPDYCNEIKIKRVPPKPKPLIPAPMPPQPMPPQPMPFPPMFPPIAMPVPYPMPTFPVYPPPMPLIPAVPQFIPPAPQCLPPAPQCLPPAPQIPMPFGIPPINPPPFAPYPPMFPPGPQAGFVPGMPGLVTQDGGINILPFSDAYSDMLEKHKQKMIRKRLQKVLDDFEDYPRKRKYRKYRNGKYF